MALLLGAPAQAGERAAERVIERRVTAVTPPRGPSPLKTAMMKGHNAARAAVGVAPLVWSDTLAASAAGYARTMARTGRFQHAEQPMGAGGWGENLWTGTRYAYGYPEMFGYWLAEQKNFVNGVTPAFSRTGQWGDVAHYTQIVWRTSTRVGCAVASSKTDDYLVCRYSQPGNVVGERTF
jgi:uncharacterized protein YkwD